MFCIAHYGGDYDNIHYVYVFDNMLDSTINKADNRVLCYLVAIALIRFINHK